MAKASKKEYDRVLNLMSSIFSDDGDAAEQMLKKAPESYWPINILNHWESSIQSSDNRRAESVRDSWRQSKIRRDKEDSGNSQSLQGI
jgi:hypothetical protein